MQAFDGHLPKISLQKLLFLFTTRQAKPDYDFVPYKFGCYSFSAAADLKAMVGHGILAEDKASYNKTDKTNYIASLNEKDKIVLVFLKNNYANLDESKLIKHTYLNYPYFAINSEIATNILSSEQYSRVLEAVPTSEKTILFTIGYEGISLEEYLNRLLKNDVKVLVDVRNNPLSMKFGFSKTNLKSFCNSLKIEYLHIPEVGIKSAQRQELNTQSDYDKLFDLYKKTNLTNTTAQQEQILDLLRTKKRVALTCFEANICQCHRKHLAEAITSLPNWKFALKHI